MPDTAGIGLEEEPIRQIDAPVQTGFSFPSQGIFRPITIQPKNITATRCGSLCVSGNTKQFPGATNRVAGPSTITVEFDASKYAGRKAHLEFYHGYHSYPAMSTTTKVSIGGTMVDEVSTSACQGPDNHKTPSFEIPSGSAAVSFEVTKSNGAPQYTFGWFLLGRGVPAGQPLQPDVVLVIEPLLRFGLLPF